MNIFVLSTFCFGFSALLLGFMIYMKRRDKLGKLWFIYSSVISLWATGYAFQINNAVDFHRGLWASRFADAAAVFIPFCWLRFIYEFLGMPANKKLFRPLLWISVAIFLTFPTPFFIPTLKKKSHIGFDHFVTAGPMFHLFTAIFVVAVLYGFYLTFKAYFRPDLSLERRNQIRIFFLASSLGFFGGSMAFLPVYNINLPVGFGTLVLPFFPFLMAFAMTRYRLLDVDEVIKVAHREKLAAIGTLAASINHEIRNPLYVIQGLAGSFLENVKDNIYPDSNTALERANEIFRKTENQATRAMDIMKRFAIFVKQSVNQEAQMESVNLSAVMDDILPLVNHELRMDKIELVRNIPESISPIRADRRHVEEILFNLIVNACQAMKAQETGARIEIGAEQHNGTVKVKVEDNGPGIPAGRLSKIFEPFYTTKEEGTGLGLYITKQLVERNKGKILVKSELWKGTAFTLEFKRACEKEG